MKTILIAHNYTKENFSAMSYELANYLAKNNFRVIFITHQPKFEEIIKINFENGELLVFSWPSNKRPSTLKDVIWFCRLYYKYKPSVVIGHFVGSNISIVFSKILSFGRVKTYEYYHTLSTQIIGDLKIISIKQKILFLRKRFFYKLFCDKIICPSDFAKLDILNFHGVSNSVVIVNPMLDRFVNFYENNNQIIISYLGRFDSSKGIIDLINAFKKYKFNNKNSRLILNIAGTGRQKNEIELSIKNGIDINFINGLNYSEIDNYLCRSHYTIIPSKFDNLPTVGLESLMNGTPILISNNTGLTSYLTEDYDCYKFEPKHEGIYKVFEKVEANFTLNSQMKINSRKTFVSTFSMEQYCNTILKLIT